MEFPIFAKLRSSKYSNKPLSLAILCGESVKFEMRGKFKKKWNLA